MARPKLFSDRQFKDAYAKAENIQDISTALGVSNVTIGNYRRRLKLPPIPKAINQSAEDLFQEYQCLTSIADLAVTHKQHPSSIRSRLRTAIVQLWRKKQKYPAPIAIGHIKVFHELRRTPSLYDDPEQLAALTGLSPTSVADYLQRVYKFQTKGR